MKAFQYLAIAAELEQQINKGMYPIGSKLPSLRLTSERFRVSVGTVLKSLMLLVDNGLVAGKERSGYIVLRKSVTAAALPRSSKTVPAAGAVRLNRSLNDIAAVPAGNRAAVSFFNAVPDAALLPLNAIRRSLQLASRDLTSAHLLYEQTAGNPLLRTAIAARAFRWRGMLSPDDVVITNGALEAVGLCLRAVTEKGDTIVVETPFYYGILQTIAAMGLKIIELPGDSLTGIDVAQLEQVCGQHRIAACVLISNFNNPNGTMLSDKKKQAIAAFANRMKIPVIDDDIYGDLHFDAERPSNIKSYDKDGWVMLCSSFSKSVAPGYRIGWCAPGRFTEQVVQLKAVTNVATTSIVQLSLLQLLKTGAYDRHLRKLRPELHRIVLLTLQAIEKYFPKGTRVSRPGGGLVLWVELPKGINAAAVQRAAAGKQIQIAPGVLFSNRGDYTNYLRISCSNLWVKKTEQALRRLADIIHDHLPGRAEK
jgi:DNA-binding transcriptional MocR family regulator